MILNSDHCKLCDLKIVDFSKGTLCSLTNQRPNFNKTCRDISFKNEIEKQITEVNIEYESVLKSKTNDIGLAWTNIIIGLFIIGLSMLITYFIFQKGFISTITIILFGVALIPIGKGVGGFNHYNTKLKIAKEKKNKLDQTLALYKKSYRINIQHIKDSLGNVEHKVDLKIN